MIAETEIPLLTVWPGLMKIFHVLHVVDMRGKGMGITKIFVADAVGVIIHLSPIH